MADLKAALSKRDWQAAQNRENEIARAGPRALPLLAEVIANRNDRGPEGILLRQHAAWAAGEVGGEEARTVLTQALQSDDVPEVRGQALLALARLPQPAVLKTLETVLLDPEEDAELRSSAATALAVRADAAATRFLLETFQGHDHPGAEEWIVQALGRSSRAELAAPFLAQLATSNSSAALRGAAAVALARLQKAEALPVLEALLTQDAPEAVRTKTVEALGEIGSVAPAQKLLLKALQEDPSPAVRAASALHLGLPKCVQLVEPLTAAFAAEKVLYVRQRILLALGNIGGPEAEAALQRVISSGEALPVKKAAQAALHRLRGEDIQKPPSEPQTDF